MSDQDQQAPDVEPTGGAPDHAASLYPDTPAPEPLDTETDDAVDTSTDTPDGADATPPADAGDVNDAPDAADELHQRQLAAVERFERAAATYENAANRYRNAPTPENQRAAEKAQSKLQQIAEAEDLDLEPGAAIKTVASEFEGYQRQQGESQAQYDARLSRIEQQQSQIQDQLQRQQIEADHPHLKGKYDSLIDQARQRAEAEARNWPGQLTSEAWAYIAQKEWNAVFSEAAKQATPPELAKPPAPAKPKATQPIKTNSGSRGGGGPPKSPAEILYPDGT